MAELKMDNRRYFFSFGPAQRAEEAWPSVVDGKILVCWIHFQKKLRFT